MTIDLFRADPYRQEFVAQIVRRSGRYVALEQTCFAPRGLHVPHCDHGWLGSDEVVDVRCDEQGSLLHGLLGSDGLGALPLGTPVVGRIDWPRRYRMMRLHTAQHLTEIALRTTHDVIGVSPAPFPATEFPATEDVLALAVVGRQSRFDVSAVRDWITMTVREDLPMVVGREQGPSSRWTWHLDGFGHRYCDGVHVNSTGEVGVVNVEAHESGRRSVLLTIEVANSDIHRRR